jgi:hypothetical protein
MEFSLKMAVVAIIVLIVLIVCVSMIVNWGGQSSSAIDGIMKFFQSLLGGKQMTNVPSLIK